MHDHDGRMDPTGPMEEPAGEQPAFEREVARIEGAVRRLKEAGCGGDAAADMAYRLWCYFSTSVPDRPRVPGLDLRTAFGLDYPRKSPGPRPGDVGTVGYGPDHKADCSGGEVPRVKRSARRTGAAVGACLSELLSAVAHGTMHPNTFDLFAEQYRRAYADDMGKPPPAYDESFGAGCPPRPPGG